MALPLGKLTLIIGAGLAGSIIAKQGCTSHMSGFLSSAFKSWKKLKRDDSNESSAKLENDSLKLASNQLTPEQENDSLLQQVNTLMVEVNNLREQLQLLASSRSLKSFTSTTSGFAKYGVIIIVLASGCGYIWWKGWSRGLKEACTLVGKELDNVYFAILANKQHLLSGIDRLDRKIDMSLDKDNTAATKEEDAASLSGTSTNQPPSPSASDVSDKLALVDCFLASNMATQFQIPLCP